MKLASFFAQNGFAIYYDIREQFVQFLAATSSSRSDGVTKFVCTLFFSLVSLKSVCFNGVSRKFQGCFKEVSRVF